MNAVWQKARQSIALPIHPFLLGILPILKVWEMCCGSYLPEQYAFLFASIFAIAAILLAIIFSITKDLGKSGLITTVIVGAIYFWIGFSLLVHTMFPKLSIGEFAIAAVYLLLFANAIWVISRWAPARVFNVGLNLVAMVSIFAAVSNIYPAEMQIQKMNKQLAEIIDGEFADVRLKSPAEKPDIYFIIVDAYDSPATLESQFKYKSKLVEYLKSRGFFIAEKATAAHDRTSSSIPSTLNMRYFDDLIKTYQPNGESRFRLMQNNQTAKLLKSLGYRFVNVSSGWEPTDFNFFADENIGWAPGGSFHISLSKLTILSLFEEHFRLLANLFLESRMRANNHEEKILQSESPKFVLIHSLLVHPPFFLDENGHLQTLAPKLMNEQYRSNEYLEQLKFADKQITHLVERLLSSKTSKPLIIIESDHGSSCLEESFDNDFPNERMRILAAFYLPQESMKKPPDDICAVNTFRWLLSNYFGANLPILPKRNFLAIPACEETRLQDASSKISF